MEPEDNAGLGSPNSTPEENTGLQSSRDSAIEFEDDIYDIAPPGHMASDEDLDLDGNIYTKQPPEEVEMDGEVYEISGEGHMPDDDDLELEGTVYSPVEKPEEPPMTKEARLKQISESLADLVTDIEDDGDVETDEAGTSDGAKKAWRTRQTGGRSSAKPGKDLRDFGGSESPYSAGAPRTAQSQLLSSKGNRHAEGSPKEWNDDDERTSSGKSTGKKGTTDPFHERNEDPRRDNDKYRISARTGDVNWDQRFDDHDGKGAMNEAEMEDDEYADEEVSGPPADSYMPATNLLKTEESIIIKGKNGFYKKPVYKKKV